jgi:hypothetical protein
MINRVKVDTLPFAPFNEIFIIAPFHSLSHFKKRDFRHLWKQPTYTNFVMTVAFV